VRSVKTTASSTGAREKLDKPPASPDTAQLARLIATYAPHNGRFNLSIPGVAVAREARTNSESTYAISQAGLCIVAQGAKRVILGRDVYEYDASHIVVYSADVPVAANVIRASPSEPYLVIVVRLDPQRIAELALKAFPHGLPKPLDTRALYIGQSDAKVVSAAARLLELAAEPEGATLLAPLVIDEIILRLLLSPLGASVAQIGMADSSLHKIARAISWLRENYAETMKVEALAEMAAMSASSFHQHFKAVTSMSPLQFQKLLRLQEARRLMLSMMMDVNAASLRVGYLSASQFSREYNRFFGSPPATDIGKLRDRALSGRTQSGLEENERGNKAARYTSV
jgi:AraC-like DNA-binding protein